MSADMNSTDKVVGELSPSGFTLGVRDDGSLWSWGANDDGQLGTAFAHLYSHGPVRAGTDTRVRRAERLRVSGDHPALAAVERHFIGFRGEGAVVARHGRHAHFDGRARSQVRAFGGHRDPEPGARRARARGHEERGEERDARARAPRTRFRMESCDHIVLLSFCAGHGCSTPR